MLPSGKVISLHLLVKQRNRPESVRQVKAVVDIGLEGDVHGKKKAGDRRQLLIVDRATLHTLNLQAGDLREQITVDFPPLETLPVGTLLRIGQATCELTGACEPCTHIGKVLAVADPAAFQRSLEGRRGQLARVTGVEGDGLISVGDAVTVSGSRHLTFA